TLEDLESPWRWKRAEAHLTPEAFADFRRRLDQSGFRAGAPSGLTLYSVDFWWLAAGCADGEFHFAAWVYPDPGFMQLKFPELLFALDETGVAVSQPHEAFGDKLHERGRP